MSNKDYFGLGSFIPKESTHVWVIPQVKHYYKFIEGDWYFWGEQSDKWIKCSDQDFPHKGDLISIQEDHKSKETNKIKELELEIQRQIELRRIEWNKFQALKSELKALSDKYQ